MSQVYFNVFMVNASEYNEPAGRSISTLASSSTKQMFYLLRPIRQLALHVLLAEEGGSKLELGTRSFCLFVLFQQKMT